MRNILGHWDSRNMEFWMLSLEPQRTKCDQQNIRICLKISYPADRCDQSSNLKLFPRLHQILFTETYTTIFFTI